MRFFAIARNYKRGTAKLLDHARCGNADHSAMPAIAVNHHTKSVAQRWLFFHAHFNRFKNFPLFFLPRGIELIEFVSDFLSVLRILRTEQVNHIARNIHAPRRINPWGNAETDFARRQRASAQLGNFQQRF